MRQVILVAVLLVGFFPAMAQSPIPPDDVDTFVSEFGLIGKQSDVYYFLNPVRVTRKGDRVGFYGFVYIDKDNYLLSVIEIDCLAFRFRLTESWGRLKGVRGHRKGDGKLDSIPHGSAISRAHRLLCGQVS